MCFCLCLVRDGWIREDVIVVHTVDAEGTRPLTCGVRLANFATVQDKFSKMV